MAGPAMVRDKRMMSPGTPCEQEGPSHCCSARGPQEVPQLPPQVVILKRGGEFTALRQHICQRVRRPAHCANGCVLLFLQQFAGILVVMDFVHGQTCVRAPTDNFLPTAAQLEVRERCW